MGCVLVALLACFNTKLVLGTGGSGRSEPAGANETDATWQGKLSRFTPVLRRKGWVRGSLILNSDLWRLMFVVCCIADFRGLSNDLV